MPKVIGVVNDLHGPFEDDRSVNLVLDTFEDIGIEHLILNGDVLDFYNLNSHGPKHPDIQGLLEDEIYWGIEFLQKLRKRFPKTKITYLFGNHEWRLDRFLLDKVPSFWNLFRLNKMLELEKLKIEWFDYNYCYQIDRTNLFIQHSPPSYSENLAMTSLKKKMDASFIYGCSHRLDFACKTGQTGNVYSVYANGWLGSTTKSKEHNRVFSYAKGHQNWQQGGSLVYVDGKEFFVNQFMIKNYKVAVNGFLYEG